VQMGEEPISPTPKPLVIHFTKSSSVPPGRQPIMIQTSFPFPYKSEKAVPWKYGVNVLRGKEKGEEKDKNLDNNEAISNIVGIEGIISSGRLFVPLELRSEYNYRERSKDEAIADKARAFLEKPRRWMKNPEGV